MPEIYMNAMPISWLDYTIMNNPNGVMLVLAKYGFMGYLAPQDHSEIAEAAMMLQERYGDPATEDLLRVHPDFEILREVPEAPQMRGFMDNLYGNFTGLVPQKSSSTKTLMIAGGAFLLAYFIFKQ